jgi:hypothetical protein
LINKINEHVDNNSLKVDVIQILREMSNYVHVVHPEGDSNAMVGKTGLPPGVKSR